MPVFKSILLVDDDPIAIFISKALIENLGLAGELLSAGSCHEGLSYLPLQTGQKSLLPDLILLDVNMPLRSGFDFLEELNSLNLEPRPIVYMLTSSQSPKDQLRAAELGADGFLAKPLTEESLLKLADAVKNSY